MGCGASQVPKEDPQPVPAREESAHESRGVATASFPPKAVQQPDANHRSKGPPPRTEGGTAPQENEQKEPEDANPEGVELAEPPSVPDSSTQVATVDQQQGADGGVEPTTEHAVGESGENQNAGASANQNAVGEEEAAPVSSSIPEQEAAQAPPAASGAGGSESPSGGSESPNGGSDAVAELDEEVEDGAGVQNSGPAIVDEDTMREEDALQEGAPVDPHDIPKVLQQQQQQSSQKFVVAGKIKKKGEGLMAGWRERFIVLNRGTWSYYVSEDRYDANEDPNKGRTIRLENYVVEKGPDRNPCSFYLRPIGDPRDPGIAKERDGKTPRVFYLRAMTPEEREQWVPIFIAAGCHTPESAGEEAQERPPALHRRPTPVPVSRQHAGARQKSSPEDVPETMVEEEEGDEDEEAEGKGEERPKADQPEGGEQEGEQPAERQEQEGEQPVERQEQGEQPSTEDSGAAKPSGEADGVAPAAAGAGAGAGDAAASAAASEEKPAAAEEEQPRRLRKVKSGYLTKKGGGTGLFAAKSWRKRFVVIEDGKMRYWTNAADFRMGKTSIKDAVVDVTKYKIAPQDDTDDLCMIKLVPISDRSLRSWELKADSPEERDEWVEAFKMQGAWQAYQEAGRVAAGVANTRRASMGQADDSQV